MVVQTEVEIGLTARVQTLACQYESVAETDCDSILGSLCSK